MTVDELARALVLTRIVHPDAVEDSLGYDDGVTMDKIASLHRKLAQQAELVMLDIKPPNPEGATQCIVRWCQTNHRLFKR